MMKKKRIECFGNLCRQRLIVCSHGKKNTYLIRDIPIRNRQPGNSVVSVRLDIYRIGFFSDTHVFQFFNSDFKNVIYPCHRVSHYQSVPDSDNADCLKTNGAGPFQFHCIWPLFNSCALDPDFFWTDSGINTFRCINHYSGFR